ncbi:2OG-Fe(II) oxygenase [Pusillimonas sp. CC-YST705]|uniref:2OG-Fe(II) oxygenase n=1 Tax=Mesopusillimonas faecipullorum TaxID=2755040 RepID=A0ABS8C960_9BURK|nr:2OG-Fe(II) oxygenase [Mesopusillimonas faecipullorum]MCB5362560.1 2OG-Fe(II) oxygenase [Mesopusillimonas faecipullorum]
MSDDILPAALAQGLRQEAQRRWESGLFRTATVGPTLAKRQDTDIRGDSICWLQAHDVQADITAFHDWAVRTQGLLNREFFIGLRWLECHFARYGSGAGYTRHVDQHVASSARKISLVLYLNPDWQQGDGGELCIYHPESPDTEQVRIAPRMGRLMLFRSDLIPHAVLPCSSARWSLTGWFRSDEPA